MLPIPLLADGPLACLLVLRSRLGWLFKKENAFAEDILRFLGETVGVNFWYLLGRRGFREADVQGYV